MAQPTPLIILLAETRRFELLKGLTPYLVSSEAHSTGLCDVSELRVKNTTSQGRELLAASNPKK
jgi:hypothetical protein